MAAQSIPIPPSNQGGKTPRWTQPVSFYGQSVFSKYYAHSICAFLLLVPFLVMPVAAQAGQGPIAANGCVNPGSYNASIDYFAGAKVEVDHATLFSVTYKNNYKIVTDLSVNATYVLTQCGTPAPSPSLFSNTTVFFMIPVQNVASLETTTVSYLEMLGERVAIKVVDTEGLVSSPCVQLGLEGGEIIGLADTNATLRASQLQKVDLIFNDFAVASDNSTANKTVITAEVSDPGPLNRAEWLEFYSTFFNLENAAMNLTNSINNNYNCFKNIATAATNKPVVAWTSYLAPSAYNNATWSMSSAAYKQILTVDAGATFYNGTTVSSFSTSAGLLDALKNVDIIIDESYTGADINAFYANYGLAASSTLKFVQNKAIFREDGLVNPNDGRDWFAGAVVMDDAVLQDVIRAVHPELLPTGTTYNWLRNIAKNETEQLLSSANCTATDSSKPVPDRALNCKTMKVGGGSSSAATKIMTGALTAVLGLMAIAFSL